VSDESFDDQQDSPNWRRELEEKARRADDLEAQLAEVKRQQAFNEAGITSANPAYKYFTKGYDGEMTVDAIKVAATEAGVLQTNQQASTQQDSPMLSQSPSPDASTANRPRSVSSRGPSRPGTNCSGAEKNRSWLHASS